jgi:hypothetical protein
MSRKSNLAQGYPIACALFLLPSSTAWAAAVSVHVNVPVVHPKVAVVNVKSNVSNTAHTTGGSMIGSATAGAGKGSVKSGGELEVYTTIPLTNASITPYTSGTSVNSTSGASIDANTTKYTSGASVNGTSGPSIKIKSKGHIH